MDLLERRIPGQRIAVRAALAKVLKPNLRKKGATDTHTALLQLARDRNNNVKLVTTNFDRIFLHQMARVKPAILSYEAPLLPIPKNGRWNGVVHLHGVLPKTPDESSLNRLIVSSGDFGLAYLTERWAARFVSELFRNYIVCFVGYSINDPVLRYMMDALAADKMLGQFSPQAYAFGSYSSGNKGKALIEWEAKGVTPILYEEHTTLGHSAFHSTLSEWAAIYRDGVWGKERIIAQYAVNPPMASTIEDNYVGRILWAISDKSGLPAKRFAELYPAPPLAWLESLTQGLFKQIDLPRFGVSPNVEIDDKLSFSLVRRPTPYMLAPSMTLFNAGIMDTKWDDVMFQLGRWLVRHLDDPNMVLIIAKAGGQLHEQFAWMIGQEIIKLNRLEKEGKQDELDRIRIKNPAAVPRPAMRVLWSLLLSGRVKSYARYADLFNWLSRFKLSGLTPILQMELRGILEPRVRLSEPYLRDTLKKDSDQIGDLVRWEVVLNTEHPHSTMGDLQNTPQWQEALPELLQDFTALLRDILNLNRELGGVNDKSDHSYSDQPSISEHDQNRRFHDWTLLIELVRDAWMASAKLYNDQARMAAEGWWLTPYPVFKRLALFAAAQGTVIPPEVALDWLLADEAWCLWSEELRRETMRLLVALAHKLDATGLSKLEQAILKGPPRDLYRSDIESELWSRIANQSVWLRLEKMRFAGANLGQVALTKLNDICQLNPQFKLATDERDEFPFWMDSGFGADNELFGTFKVSPRRRKDLVAWLKEHPSADTWAGDDWRQRCRDEFSATACALIALNKEGVWPADRWREALQAWSEDKLLKRAWRYMAPLVDNVPNDLIEACTNSIGWWLQAISKTFEGHEDVFFHLAQRILDIEPEDNEATDDPVGRAINHPVGHITNALLNWWYRQSLQDGQGIPESIKPIFTSLCDTQIGKFRHGRLLLATNVVTLFRVDRDWTVRNLLPMFDWKHSEIEAQSAWMGFLWSPRFYAPLIEVIKPQLLDTANHYTQLGDHAHQYADFLTYIALESRDIFSKQELTNTTSALGQEGLESAAQTVARALEGSGNQRKEYWSNRVQPYLKSIWPKSRDFISSPIAHNLARICIAADEAFPEALNELKDWLIQINHPDYEITLLHQSKLPHKFPADALDFMSRIIADSTQWPPTELNECLQAIKDESPGLQKDARYMRLSEYLRRHSRS